MTSCARSSSCVASSVERMLSELTRWRSCLRRVATAPLTSARSRWVGSKRASRSRRSPPRPFSPLPEAVDQQLQVLARVGVEHREDLVRVDVRLRRADRDREAALGHRRVAAARLQVDEHVLQPGLGPQQRGRVGVDQILVLGVEVHLDHGVAVLEVDAADVADAHAGDAHGLALAGDDGLRGRELRLQLVGLRLDEREAHALVVEDVGRDAGGDQDQPDDGREVAEVLLDRGHLPAFPSFLSWPSVRSLVGDLELVRQALALERQLHQIDAVLAHLRPAVLEQLARGVDLAAASAARRAVERRSGVCCVSHGTFSFSGGRLVGFGGLTPRIGSAVVPNVLLPKLTRLVPPAASTRNHWPLASPERLSPARPGNGFGSSW